MNSNCTVQNESQSQSQVGFFRTLEQVKRQIEFDCITDKNSAEEISLIITEILRLPNDTEIKISGVKTTAEDVKAIYSKLRAENIENVIENFKKVNYKIIHIKSYLRTALYNSVFETDNGIANQVRADMRG